MREEQLKKRRIKARELKYDFLPELVEIIEKPENPIVNVILILIFTLILAALIWAASFKIDITISAYGKVCDSEDMIPVMSSYGGIVEEVYVSEGDNVKNGDTLIKFDDTVIVKEISETEKNLNMLIAQREAYKLVYSWITADVTREPVDTSDYGEFADLYEAVLLEYELFVKTLERIPEDNDKDLAIMERKLAILQNMNTIREKESTLRAEIEKENDELLKYVLKAPNDGKMEQMATINAGQKVNTSDTIGYLEVSDTRIFKAYVADEDIGLIKDGDIVRIEMAAIKDMGHESLEGTIEDISDIPINIDGLGMAYPIDILFSGQTDEIKLGMEGTAYILIGSRSVLDYFVEPFKKGFGDSLHER